jgi:hypothetical protein
LAVRRLQKSSGGGIRVDDACVDKDKRTFRLTTGAKEEFEQASVGE